MLVRRRRAGVRLGHELEKHSRVLRVLSGTARVRPSSASLLFPLVFVLILVPSAHWRAVTIKDEGALLEKLTNCGGGIIVKISDFTLASKNLWVGGMCP